MGARQARIAQGILANLEGQGALPVGLVPIIHTQSAAAGATTQAHTPSATPTPAAPAPRTTTPASGSTTPASGSTTPARRVTPPARRVTPPASRQNSTPVYVLENGSLANVAPRGVSIAQGTYTVDQINALQRLSENLRESLGKLFQPKPKLYKQVSISGVNTRPTYFEIG
jgi:hypothetical protein